MHVWQSVLFGGKGFRSWTFEESTSEWSDNRIQREGYVYHQIAHLLRLIKHRNRQCAQRIQRPIRSCARIKRHGVQRVWTPVLTVRGCAAEVLQIIVHRTSGRLGSHVTGPHRWSTALSERPGTSYIWTNVERSRELYPSSTLACNTRISFKVWPA